MNPKQYVLGFVFLLVVPAFGWFAAISPVAQSRIFAWSIEEVNYLANLRDPELACRSLALRRPGLLVIGDSHSYAGWDFQELEARSGLRVGACALGGLYLDSVPLLLDFAASSSPETRIVILGLSPRMLWDSAARHEQIAHHAQAIPAMRPDAKPFLRHRMGLAHLTYDTEAAAVERHRASIEALDESAVIARLGASTSSIRSLRDWHQRLRQPAFSAELPQVSAVICSRVRKSGLRLWVVHVPESPYLESRYDSGIWKAYLRELSALSTCAEKMVVEKALTYGLGNRHYVNRQLLDTHDYGMWNRNQAVADDTAFDADHLNPVGARRFTLAISKRLFGD